MSQVHKIKLLRANLKRDLRAFSNMVFKKYIEDSICSSLNGRNVEKVDD